MTTTVSIVRGRFNLGRVDQIPLGEGRRFDIHGVSLAVFRTRGQELFAIQAECPHKGGPLADGVVGVGRVICPLHGHAFELRTGQPLANCCGPLKTYPVRVSETGHILLDL